MLCRTIRSVRFGIYLRNSSKFSYHSNAHGHLNLSSRMNISMLSKESMFFVVLEKKSNVYYPCSINVQFILSIIAMISIRSPHLRMKSLGNLLIFQHSNPCLPLHHHLFMIVRQIITHMILMQMPSNHRKYPVHHHFHLQSMAVHHVRFLLNIYNNIQRIQKKEQ